MNSNRTRQDLARTLIQEGKVIERRLYPVNFAIVEAFGHTYRIDNPVSKNPIITQEDRTGK